MTQISKKLKYNAPAPKNIENAGIVRVQNYNDAVEDITSLYTTAPGEWIDISNTSTVVGWASFTTKSIKYMVINKMVVVTFNIQGTSNAVTSTFTVPIASSASATAAVDVCFGVDNGTPGVMTAALPVGTSTVNLVFNLALPWTNSGAKTASGHVIYEIA
jgi:hypothetical protein